MSASSDLYTLDWDSGWLDIKTREIYCMYVYHSNVCMYARMSYTFVVLSFFVYEQYAYTLINATSLTADQDGGVCRSARTCEAALTWGSQNRLPPSSEQAAESLYRYSLCIHVYQTPRTAQVYNYMHKCITPMMHKFIRLGFVLDSLGSKIQFLIPSDRLLSG